MPKRSRNKIAFYEQKIKELKEKANKRRRVIVYSSSSDSEENQDIGAKQNELLTEVPPIDVLAGHENVTETFTPLASDQIEQSSEAPELTPELLLALGEASDEPPIFGENIHPSLAQRCLPILKKGLSKEIKEKLLNDYAIPENCKLLKAPNLNPEISAAVAETVRYRDKNIQRKQDQLGHGLSAISKAITILLSGDDKLKAIKVLSDGCRILTDLHFMESQARTKLLTPGLGKSFLSVVQNPERDETLFGNNLTEKIKASKAIEKQGNQIKKASTTPRNPTQTSTPSTSRSRYQGNWTAPPRYSSSNRGGAGRGGPHRAATTAIPYRRTFAPTTTTPIRTSFSQNKQHAPRQ